MMQIRIGRLLTVAGVLFIAVIAPVIFSGCGSSPDFRVKTDVIPYSPEQEIERQAALSARYRLREGDILDVSFKYEKGLSQENVIVLPDGYVNIRGLDTGVRASGLTVEEFDQVLTETFAQELRNPALSVIISKVSEPGVYVMGMVNKPGLQRLPWEGLGVIQAISAAGGFAPDANRSETVLLRATDEGFMMRVFNLDDFQQVGFDSLLLMDVQPYDIIYVPRSQLGDFAYLTKTLFGGALNVTRLFWDVYAITNLDKIDRIVR